MIALDLQPPQFGGKREPCCQGSLEARERTLGKWFGKSRGKIGEQSEPAGVWGRESPLLGSLCSPIFLLLHSVFVFIPHYGAWSQPNLGRFFP